MGGYGSGTHGGKPTVDDSLVLDLNKLIRDQVFRPGQAWCGSIVWREVYSGDETARIGYEAHMGEESGSVRLYYTITSQSGEKRSYDYWIELATTPQPFGGRRWWWICPSSGRRVSKLYKPDGAGTFASRFAYRLTYRSQNEGPIDRARERALKLRRRLGSKGGFDDFILKPKGMHSSTFDRKLKQVCAAEARCNAEILVTLRRRTR